MNDFKKIRDVLKGLSCEELIDVYNSVLKALGAKEQEYIYENSDEALDRVFKDWEPSEIMHYLDDRDWLNADYFAYDDAYGWQTLDDAKDAVEECVDIDNLAVAIGARSIHCGVPEIDRLLQEKEGEKGYASQETTDLSAPN